MVPVNMTFTLVDSEEGSFVLVVLVDLSERWRTERELRQSAEQIQRTARELHEMRLLLIQAEKMDSMGRLAAGVAHEVKNPLAMLQLGLELIEGRIPGDDVRAQSVLSMMQEAIDRANLIVGEMLDISRSRQLEVSPHDINELVSETLRLGQHELVTSKTTTCLSLAPAPLLVLVDRAKLLQVFLNLVINATHAMETGGTLAIRTARTSMGEVNRNDGARTSDHLRTHDDVVTIVFEDTGCGIPEGLLHRIFDPFFTTKPTGKGTGLGLTIAKSIIELHRGEIALENRNPKGARVTISLPAAPNPSNLEDERS